MKTERDRGWLKGVFSNVDDASTHDHAGLAQRLRAEANVPLTQDQRRHMALIEHDSAIMLINAKLDHMAKESAQLVEDRRTHQDALTELMAAVGLRVEVARG